MNDYKIPLSSAPLRWQLALSAVLVLLACGSITLFFHYAVSVLPGLQTTLLTILWITLPLMWVLGTLLAFKNHSSTGYILTDKALAVQKKGWLGQGSKRLYGYDTILSVHSLSRAHGAYGTIELIVKDQKPVVLRGVVLPDEHAQRIKRLVSTSRDMGAVQQNTSL